MPTVLTALLRLLVVVQMHLHLFCWCDNANMLEIENSTEYRYARWLPQEKFNIVFVKIPKCSSSSAAGVMRTVAYNRGLKQDIDIDDYAENTDNFLMQMKLLKVGSFSEAKRNSHWFRTAERYWNEHLEEPIIFATRQAADAWQAVQSVQERLKLPSFLTAWVREPAGRCYSAYYTVESLQSKHGNVTMTKKEYLQHRCRNVLSLSLRKLKRHDLSMESVDGQPDGKEVAITAWGSTPYQSREANATAQSLLSPYHFVGITERYEESVIALKHVLDGNFKDVLTLPARHHKIGGQRDKRMIGHLMPANETDEDIQEFMQKNFLSQNSIDYAVYYAANAQLDRIIQKIPHFTAQLNFYRAAQFAAQSNCSVLRNNCKCLYLDSGCCFECVGKVVSVMRSRHARGRRKKQALSHGNSLSHE